MAASENEIQEIGRPTLYTLPRVLAILAALFKGASRAEAARRAGVGVSTFYVWLQLDQNLFADGSRGAALNPPGTRFAGAGFGHGARENESNESTGKLA